MQREREIATAIADELFASERERNATRLVMFREETVGDMGENLGGYCKEAVIAVIERHLLALALSVPEGEVK